MAEQGAESPSPDQSGAGSQKPAEAAASPLAKPASSSPAPPSPNATPGNATAAPEAQPPPIADHELLHCIGRGSYGEVWLARNVLGEHRAVKIIHRRHFDSDHAYEREFEGLKRYEPVSRGDPSQVAVLQVGRNDTAGFYYYVMELADAAEPPVLSEGGGSKMEDGNEAAGCPGHPASSILNARTYVPRTLRHELQTRQRVPLDECVQIGLALTTALNHLHRQGLIHRDIKPSNVIFVNGVPKLADIGLVARMDATLSFVGTEGYMPPEGPGTPQADLYSLGKVLYEISTGKDRTAFPEPLTLLGEEPDKARLLELNAVIHRACHRDPRQRYPSAAAMHADLQRLERGESVRRRQRVQRRWATSRRLVLATLATAALLLSAYSLYRTFVGPREMVQSPENPVPVPLKASVFVLPFRSAVTNQVGDDLCSRVTDAFIDSLASIEGVRRSPRKSGWRYLDEDELRRALARTNDMRHVLTGRIASSNNTLALTLRLYPRRGEQPLWTGSFSGKTNELLAVEAEALRQLAGRLGLRISTAEQQRIATLLTNNLEAFHWYQQACAVYIRKAGTQSGYKEIRELAQKAMELDRRYLDADYWDAYMIRNLAQDRAPSDIWHDVQHRMASILAQDDTFAGALDHLGSYPLLYQRDWEAAYAFWNREFLYLPAQTRHWVRAYYYRVYGWREEARLEQDLSEHPEPAGGDQRFFMASARWVERRYAEGAQIARRTLELYPGHAEGYQWLAHCLVANGDYVEGIEATYKAQAVWKKQEMTALRGVAYARMGQPEKAREVLQELLEIQHTGPYLQPYFVARVYSALNEKDKALEWLEKAEQDRSEYLFLPDLGGGLRTDPAWDDLQDEPRFRALLKKVGLDRWPRPKPNLEPPPK